MERNDHKKKGLKSGACADCCDKDDDHDIDDDDDDSHLFAIFHRKICLGTCACKEMKQFFFQ